MDLYLKFKDKAEADAALYTEGSANYANIDVIGVIHKPTGETDADGNPIMAALDGWHVNVRVVDENATVLEQYQIHPTVPLRVWA